MAEVVLCVLVLVRAAAAVVRAGMPVPEATEAVTPVLRQRVPGAAAEVLIGQLVRVPRAARAAEA